MYLSSGGTSSPAVRVALELCKGAEQGIWPNSKLVVKQLDGIGPTIAKRFAEWSAARRAGAAAAGWKHLAACRLCLRLPRKLRTDRAAVRRVTSYHSQVTRIVTSYELQVTSYSFEQIAQRSVEHKLPFSSYKLQVISYSFGQIAQRSVEATLAQLDLQPVTCNL